jgi:transcriptional regulator with XRE-family HTH domain
MNRAEHLGERLRRIRQQQHLSLADVEARSEGAWKAVVVGAYERGDRAVTISRLAALAEFYGVPLGHLMPGARRNETNDGARRIVLDLTSLSGDAPEPVAAVARFAHQVQRTRGDHNGRVLSLRASDMETLALTTGRSADLLIEALRERGAIHEEDAPSAV